MNEYENNTEMNYGNTPSNENENGFSEQTVEQNQNPGNGFAANVASDPQTEAEHVEADKVYEPQGGFNNSYNYAYGGNGNYANRANPNFSQPNYSRPNFSQPQQPGNKPEGKKKSKGVVVLCCILAAVLLFTGGLFESYTAKKSSSTPGSNSSSSSSSSSEKKVESGGSVVLNAKADADALTTTEIAQIAKKSSVGVVVYSTATNSFAFGQSSSSNSDSNKTGEGTGVIIELDDQGDYAYVVTCAHVISEGNISVKILLEDGTTYDAEIVGIDEQTDVGLLRVKEKSLQKLAATIGTSANLQVGQSVFAMGNPGGSDFFGSFTSGVVSAIGRSLSSTTGYTMECIQHDAAINPGNSGGGLYNAQGQLIGINSSKIASTEYEGMSFAIPIDEAVSVVNSLSSFGYVPNRPKLGINYALARTYNQAYQMIVSFKGLPSGTLLIAKISSESSLNDLGVKVGDMIVSANGKKLDTADVLLDMIENGKVGDVIELGICRVETNNSTYNVKEFTVKATLVEDKGSKSSDEEQTTQSYQDYFNYFFGNGN